MQRMKLVSKVYVAAASDLSASTTRESCTNRTSQRRQWLRMAAGLIASGGAAAALAGGWSAPVTITGYYTWDSGTAYITTSSNQNPDNCNSSHYLYLDTTQPNFKSIYSAVMLAQSTGQTVSLSYAGCSPGNSYPYINSVAVPNIW